MSVVNINVTPVMAVKSTVVIVYVQTTNSGYPTTIVVDVHIPNLGYPTIVIVVDGDIFHLNNRTVIVILYIWVVIVTRIKSNIGMAKIYVGIHAISIVNIEIELPIWVYRKCDAIFNEYK